MNTSIYKQTTLEQYKNWYRTERTPNQNPINAPNEPTHKEAAHHTNTNEYKHPPIKAATFNTIGIHNTILGLQNIINNNENKPTILHLTETKHVHIKSMWREVLKDYKLIYTHPTLDLNTNKRSGGTILAARRDTCKEVIAIPTPPHIGD
jgi:hypothetical protein